jgi:hypothetical protein
MERTIPLSVQWDEITGNGSNIAAVGALDLLVFDAADDRSRAAVNDVAGRLERPAVLGIKVHARSSAAVDAGG